MLALPGSDDSGIRGLSINGVLVLDEAARVSDALFNASLPMVLRYAKTARVLVASTAWAARGFFYRLWTEGEGWNKIRADIHECSHLTPEDIERERRSMPAAAFRREYAEAKCTTEWVRRAVTAAQKCTGPCKPSRCR